MSNPSFTSVVPVTPSALKDAIERKEADCVSRVKTAIVEMINMWLTEKFRPGQRFYMSFEVVEKKHDKFVTELKEHNLRLRDIVKEVLNEQFAPNWAIVYVEDDVPLYYRGWVMAESMDLIDVPQLKRWIESNNSARIRHKMNSQPYIDPTIKKAIDSNSWYWLPTVDALRGRAPMTSVEKVD